MPLHGGRSTVQPNADTHASRCNSRTGSLTRDCQSPIDPAKLNRMNPKAETFYDLLVYQEACKLDHAIFERSKHWPREEMYALTDQIRRSSRSIGANIAEAWAKRRYPAHFTSKLSDADAELQETQHWLLRAQAYGYLNAEAFAELWQSAKQAGRRLGSMMQSGNWS